MYISVDIYKFILRTSNLALGGLSVNTNVYTLYAENFEYCFRIMEFLPVARKGCHWAVCSSSISKDLYCIWESPNAPEGY